MSHIITDRMIVLARQLNKGISSSLSGCDARVTTDLKYMRVDKSGKVKFVEQQDFKEFSDNEIISKLESYFN